MNPAFLLFLGIMLAAALIRPVQTAASVVPSGDYVHSAFSAGFLQGYDTLDALAGLRAMTAKASPPVNPGSESLSA